MFQIKEENITGIGALVFTNMVEHFIIHHAQTTTETKLCFMLFQLEPQTESHDQSI